MKSLLPLDRTAVLNILVLCFAGLMLNIDREEYLVSTSGGIGYKVVIHEPYVTPRVHEDAIALEPGTETYISLSRTRETILGTPYSSVECSQHSGFYSTDFIQLSQYSYEGCMLSCMLENSINTCNCSFRRSDEPGTDKACSLLDFYSCIYERFGWYHTTTCGCLYPCESVHYQASHSSLYFPSPLFVQLARELGWPWQTEAALHDNVLHLHVFFQSLQYSEVEQVASYTCGDLIADMGGFVGLFVGASIITLLELGEFLCLVIVGRVVNGWNRVKPTDRQVKAKTDKQHTLKPGIQFVKTVHS